MKKPRVIAPVPTAPARLEILVPALIFISALVLAVCGLYPSLGPCDSAEMPMDVPRFELLHSPGYPLYLVAARLFCMLPVGNIPYRLNLFAGFLFACAAVMLWHILLEIRRPDSAPPAPEQSLAAALAAVGLLTAPLLYRYAVAAEVFSLHALIILILLWLSTRLCLRQEKKDAFWAAFLMGLGLGNHHTLIFLAPTLFLVAWPLLTPRVFSRLLALFCLGFSIYPIVWVLVHHDLSLQSWLTLKKVLFREDFGTFSLAQGLITTKAEVTAAWALGWMKNFALETARNFSPIGLLLGLLGAAHLCRRRAALGAAILLAWLLSGPFFTLLCRMPPDELSVELIHKFWVMPLVVFAVLVGAGFLAALEKLRERPWLLRSVLVLTTCGLALQFACVTQKQSRRGCFIVEDYGKNLLRSLPQGASLLLRGDTEIFSLVYLRDVAHYRADVNVVHIPAAPPSWSSYEAWLAGMINGRFKKGERVFLAAPSLPLLGAWTQAFSVLSQGLVCEIRPKAAPPQQPSYPFLLQTHPEQARGFDEDYFLAPVLNSEALGDRALGDFYVERGDWRSADACYERTLFSKAPSMPRATGMAYLHAAVDLPAARSLFSSKGIRILEELKDKDSEALYFLGIGHLMLGDEKTARDYARRSLSLDSKNSEAHNLLGITYANLKQYRQAERLFRQALALDPKSEVARANLAKLPRH